MNQYILDVRKIPSFNLPANTILVPVFMYEDLIERKEWVLSNPNVQSAHFCYNLMSNQFVDQNWVVISEDLDIEDVLLNGIDLDLEVVWRPQMSVSSVTIQTKVAVNE